MATKLYLLGGTNEATFGLGTNTADAVGTTRGWDPLALSTSPGGALTGGLRATVAGATAGLEIWFASPVAIEWYSEPLAADITISGTVTFNVWAYETNMSANVGMHAIVDRVGPTGTITQIVSSEKGTEVAVSASVGSLNNWTASPTSTAMSRGDRIRVRILGNDAGTMASGFSFGVNFAGPTTAADGDTWVQFTEDVTFESDPAGTTLYLTDTASDVSTANVDREAWTSRGAGSVDDVTNTAAGWTAPIQVTDTAGGTAVEWYTKRTAAFTLGGKAKINIRAKESATSANAGLKAEIAICNSDGSGAVVWASACNSSADAAAAFNELSTTDGAQVCWVAGPDTAVSDGQRLRIRLFVDDMHSDPLVTGQTVTTTYSGASGGAAGDTFVTLQQSISLYTPAGPPIGMIVQVKQAVKRAAYW